MTYKTLTYSEGVKGWTSFFTYYPDWMIGMNQYFYTFKGGNLFRHNTNEQRNTFYGVFNPSEMISVFNDSPLTNQIFKTINLEATSAWKATLISDIQVTGLIESAWFEKKEGSYFGFVRNEGEIPANVREYPLRSISGIGQSTSVIGTVTAPIVTFNPLIKIGSMISVGDYAYYAIAPNYDSPILAGRITDIVINPQLGTNQIVIDATIPNAQPISTQTGLWLYIKDSIAESNGIIGHYCIFHLVNSNTNKIEMFAVEADVMKSFP
jgi:hypothetical protein